MAGVLCWFSLLLHHFWIYFYPWRGRGCTPSHKSNDKKKRPWAGIVGPRSVGQGSSCCFNAFLQFVLAWGCAQQQEGVPPLVELLSPLVPLIRWSHLLRENATIICRRDAPIFCFITFIKYEEILHSCGLFTLILLLECIQFIDFTYRVVLVCRIF